MKKKENKKRAQLPPEEPAGINIPQLMYAVRKNRWWFLAYAGLGLVLALIFNFLVPQKFKIVTTMLIKSDNSQATLTSIHPEVQDDKKGSSVQDQAGILGSFTLNYQTLQRLNWVVSWSDNSFPVRQDLYQNDPFKVIINDSVGQVKGVPLDMTFLNDREFKVKCSDEQEINGEKHKIDFEQTGVIGKPFKNRYFNFTLEKLPGRFIDDGQQFRLTFNDLVQLAKGYQEELKITTGDEGSNLVTVELVSARPNRAIDYLSELDKVYIEYGLDEKNKRAANTVRFINNQISGISDSLKQSGNQFTDYRSKNDVIDIDQQSAGVVNEMDKVQGDVAAARLQLEYFTGLKRYLANAESMNGLVAPSVVGITDPSLNASIAKLSDLYHQRQVLSQTAQDKSPQMVSLNDEISYTKKSIGENVNNLVSNAKTQLNGLTSRAQSINSVKSTIPKKEQNLDKIKRNFDFNNQMYTYLLQKRSEAQIAQASRDPDAQIIDAASVGTANLKGFPHPVNLVIGLIAGALLPFIYLLMRGFFKHKLAYVEDVKEQLKPSIIGTILHNKFDNELPVMLFPHSEVTESFRSLRINVNYLLQGRENKVISIHSSIAGEGKTFVSSNLAAILALNSKSVLLVDADLRQPRTHEVFSCNNPYGLSGYLKGEASFSDVVVSSQIKGLDLVMSGPRPDYPSELLGNERMNDFVTEAKKRYEYIVFNNAPLNIVKDAMMIAPLSDLNIFLLRIHKSSVNQLKYINELIQEGIVKNVAVALNNVTADSFAISNRGDHGYYNDNRMLKLN